MQRAAVQIPSGAKQRCVRNRAARTAVTPSCVRMCSCSACPTCAQSPLRPPMPSRPSMAPKLGTRRVPPPQRMPRERPRQWRCGGATPTSAATHAPAGASGDCAASAASIQKGDLALLLDLSQAFLCSGHASKKCMALSVSEDPCKGLLTCVHALERSSTANMQVCERHVWAFAGCFDTCMLSCSYYILVKHCNIELRDLPFHTCKSCRCTYYILAVMHEVAGAVQPAHERPTYVR